MNETRSFSSLRSITNNKSKTFQRIDEVIYNLEVFIECIAENSKSFKKIENPTIYELEEFMLGYINLEDKILNCFEHLNCVRVKGHHKSKIEDLIKPFNDSWTIFQDQWNDKMWYMYENIRNNVERLKYMSYEENYEIIEVRIC